jgi:hypothetical protein
MSLPLDADGFLRQECPTCEREFKVWPSQHDDDPTPVADGGYFCPYCGIQAEVGAWFTKAQVELALEIAQREVVAPMLRKFAQDLGRQTSGIISAKVSIDSSPEPQTLTEDDDMRRVDFSCHPNDPLKVADDWCGSVRCLICGATSTAD